MSEQKVAKGKARTPFKVTASYQKGKTIELETKKCKLLSVDGLDGNGQVECTMIKLPSTKLKGVRLDVNDLAKLVDPDEFILDVLAKLNKRPELSCLQLKTFFRTHMTFEVWFNYIAEMRSALHVQHPTDVLNQQLDRHVFLNDFAFKKDYINFDSIQYSRDIPDYLQKANWTTALVNERFLDDIKQNKSPYSGYVYDPFITLNAIKCEQKDIWLKFIRDFVQSFGWGSLFEDWKDIHSQTYYYLPVSARQSMHEAYLDSSIKTFDQLLRIVKDMPLMARLLVCNDDVLKRTCNSTAQLEAIFMNGKDGKKWMTALLFASTSSQSVGEIVLWSFTSTMLRNWLLSFMESTGKEEWKLDRWMSLIMNNLCKHVEYSREQPTYDAYRIPAHRILMDVNANYFLFEPLIPRGYRYHRQLLDKNLEKLDKEQDKKSKSKQSSTVSSVFQAYLSAKFNPRDTRNFGKVWKYRDGLVGNMLCVNECTLSEHLEWIALLQALTENKAIRMFSTINSISCKKRLSHVKRILYPFHSESPRSGHSQRKGRHPLSYA